MIVFYFYLERKNDKVLKIHMQKFEIRVFLVKAWHLKASKLISSRGIEKQRGNNECYSFV